MFDSSGFLILFFPFFFLSKKREIEGSRGLVAQLSFEGGQQPKKNIQRTKLCSATLDNLEKKNE